MPYDTFNLNQDMADKNAVPNKWLKYLIFFGFLSEYREFKGRSEYLSFRTPKISLPTV